MRNIFVLLLLACSFAIAPFATAQHRHNGGGIPHVQHHNGGSWGGHPVWHGGGGPVWHGGTVYRNWNPRPAIGLGIVGGALLGAAIAEAATCSSLEEHLAQIGPPMPGFCWQPIGGNLCGNISWQQVPC